MDRKQEILHVAFKHFALHGEDLSIGAIAKDIGIRKQSIYSHFDGKDDLVEKMIKSEVGHFYIRIITNTKICGFETLKETLSFMFFSLFDVFKDVARLQFWKQLNFYIDNKTDKPYINQFREDFELFKEYVREVFKEGIEKNEIPDKDIELYLVHFLVLVFGMQEQYFYYKSDFLSQTIKVIFESYWNGIISSK